MYVRVARGATCCESGGSGTQTETAAQREVRGMPDRKGVGPTHHPIGTGSPLCADFSGGACGGGERGVYEGSEESSRRAQLRARPSLVDPRSARYVKRRCSRLGTTKGSPCGAPLAGQKKVFA
ncbi:hypothetical protein FGB62_14g124 [Gracilaria domingensis]|nr:hypothetical protein FGB62_14g124 [Gracilaria domingensis]